MTDSLDDKKEVLAANQAFYDAFSSRDIITMNKLWWQGSTSLCIHPGGRIIVSWEDIRASWDSIFKNTNSLEIDLEVIKIEVDHSLAYVVVREIVLQSSLGRKLKAESTATNIFQKMAQKWYIVSHHGSPIMR